MDIAHLGCHRFERSETGHALHVRPHVRGLSHGLDVPGAPPLGVVDDASTILADMNAGRDVAGGLAHQGFRALVEEGGQPLLILGINSEDVDERHDSTVGPIVMSIWVISCAGLGRGHRQGQPHLACTAAGDEGAAGSVDRGIAMAQLGDLARAKVPLRRAERSFHPTERVARAWCVVAEAEIALVPRDLSWPEKALDAARATLDEHGDIVAALNDVVAHHTRWGFWQGFHRLRRAGHPWNHKRVHRVYCALRETPGARRRLRGLLFRRGSTWREALSHREGAGVQSLREDRPYLPRV
jgi:hypothetical protein